MNIQELKDFFAKSDYSNETKSVISGILAGKTETTPGIISQITDVLQKELDADFNELDADTKNDPEFKMIEGEYVQALDVIEKDLNNDMDFVGKELKDLEDMTKEIAKASDVIDAAKIKQTIQNNYSK